MHESTMKTCGHVIKKKLAGSCFVMRAGLRNNEFCLRGLTSVLICDRTSTISYSMFFKAILNFFVFLETNLKF